MLREEARFELFVERAIEEIKKHPILDINKNLRNKNVVQQNNKCGLLAFADPHYNKEFKILGCMEKPLMNIVLIFLKKNVEIT